MNVGHAIHECFDALRTGDVEKAKDLLQQTWDSFREFEERCQSPEWAKEFIQFTPEEIDRAAIVIARGRGLLWAYMDEEEWDGRDQGEMINCKYVFETAMGTVLGEDRRRPLIIDAAD